MSMKLKEGRKIFSITKGLYTMEIVIPYVKKEYTTNHGRIKMEEIAKVFELEVVYDEKEVNAKIETFFEDYCTIRRDMISEGIMAREGTKYIRKK